MACPVEIVSPRVRACLGSAKYLFRQGTCICQTNIANQLSDHNARLNKLVSEMIRWGTVPDAV